VGGGIFGSNISLSGCTIKENTAQSQGGGILSEGNIIFSSMNRCNIYENAIEDSNNVGHDIAISTNYYGYAQSFLEVIVDTFTVMEPTEFHATPIDSFSFDILVGLDQLSSDDEFIPTKFTLHPPYPNPFNPTTTIRFDLVETRHAVFLHVFDITGRLVEKLVDGQIESGQHDIQWNASRFSSGLYFVELVTGKKRDVQKLILLK